MSMIYSTYSNGSCDNCEKNISIGDRIPAIVIVPYKELPNIRLFLCEECARKIKNDYTVEAYFKLVDKMKKENADWR